MSKVSETVDKAGGVTSIQYDAPRITVGYVRKTSLPSEQYKTETAEASCHVQADVNIESSDEDKAAAIKGAFLLAKGAVSEQLGLKFTVDPDLIVQETIERVLGGQVENATATTPQRTRGGQSASQRQASSNKPPKAQADLWAELEANPGGFFDNRAKKASGEAKPTSPDFKRKGTGEGLWLTNKDGDSNVPEGITLP